MNRLNFLLFVLLVGVTVSCNSPKDGVGMNEEAKTENVGTKEKTMDDVNELIDAYAGKANLTNVQEEQIRAAAAKYDLNGGTDAENKMQRRLLRKEIISTILTQEQVDALRRDRKARKGGGK